MLLLFQIPVKSTTTRSFRVSYFPDLLTATDDTTAGYSHILIFMVAPFVLSISPLSDRAFSSS